MHHEAATLEATLRTHAPDVLSCLSELGRQLYFPREGILSQSAEAKAHAHAYNATIGIATSKGLAMHLPLLQHALSAFAPNDVYPYAPPEGKRDVRIAWRDKLYSENPSLRDKQFGLPIVTHALTHGLSIASDLFVDAGDTVVVSEQRWENYDMIFGLRRGAQLATYPLYDDEGHLHVAAFRHALYSARPKGKAIVVLNFPNNPTGYTPYRDEVDALVDTVRAAANDGMRLVVVVDDAYFGLFYDDCSRESIWARLVGLHPRIVPIKVDGATKEHFVWGFRVGFLTVGTGIHEADAVLEQKTLGAIRSSISSASHLSQTALLYALQHPEFAAQCAHNVAELRRRALRVRDVLSDRSFADVWRVYPFNSGYFMCLQLLHVPSERVRAHALHTFGVGTIALGTHDLRVAYSCLEEDKIAHVFSCIASSARALR